MATLTAAMPGAGPAWTARVCWQCLRWLYDAISGARNDEPILIGSPTANGRQLAFEDQCRVCRHLLDGPAAIITLTPDNPGWTGWPPVPVCPPCETWLTGLAWDGRSARQLATRAIDGEYGDWLHPNLRSLSVAIDVADRATRAVVATVCERMGVAVAARGAHADAVFSEIPVAPGLDAARVVLMVGFDARHRLPGALGPRVAGWLTIPATPQQVAATLTQVLRNTRHAWDPVTALPVLRPVPMLPPALSVVVAHGGDVLEVTWLLRRFARGYDTVGVIAGKLVLIPRVPVARLGLVAERLEDVLRGRAVVTPLAGTPYPPRLHVSA
ncbi:MAG: hypothetical protein IT303_13730 [Dehalococcoidia bacterium]|nr:hypothetical protein [Dehalococcoidia bacterium]